MRFTGEVFHMQAMEAFGKEKSARRLTGHGVGGHGYTDRMTALAKGLEAW